MRASGNIFEVTYDAWKLYIGQPNYGALGVRNAWTWEIFQERYINCFLFEYAATLGLIDIAYVHPKYGDRAHSQLWGTEEISYLSRYDGLQYFRINPLGAYCLGLAPSYEPMEGRSEAKLSVMPSLRIRLEEGELSPLEVSLLESFCERLSEGVWQLSMEQSIRACETGTTPESLQKLLKRLDDQPLPPRAETFIQDLQSRAFALEQTGDATIFSCSSEKVAEEIASHHLTKDICMLANKQILVVRKVNLSKFRKHIRLIGYGTGISQI